MKAIVVLLAALPAFAQLVAPNPEGVAMGHVHLNSPDPAAAIRFWVESLGAQPYTHATLSGVAVPGVIILFRKASPSAPSPGSAVDHIGFKVPDLTKYVEKFSGPEWKPTRPTADGVQLMFNSPDGVRIELTEDKSQGVPIRFHHVHLHTTDPKAMQAWYLKNFGAIPSRRATWDSGEVPGANLTYQKAASVDPTAGRAIDHIGFEVHGLEAFCRKLTDSGITLDTPYREAPQLKLALAFLTDPWGTRIELTEGLGR